MGGDLIGSELNNRKGLVDLPSMLLLITCLHYTQGFTCGKREQEQDKEVLKKTFVFSLFLEKGFWLWVWRRRCVLAMRIGTQNVSLDHQVLGMLGMMP